jgi:hypothetical protein
VLRSNDEIHHILERRPNSGAKKKKKHGGLKKPSGSHSIFRLSIEKKMFSSQKSGYFGPSITQTHKKSENLFTCLE